MLRVVSYNIRKAVGADRLRRPDRILAVLEEVDGDVIALQEADRRIGARSATLPQDLLAASKWRVVPMAVRPDSMGWHGNALLVRRDAQILHAERIELPSLEPRGAIFAEVAFATERLRVVGMHLDLSGLKRASQAERILSATRGRPRLPCVMMGDTNEWTRTRGCIPNFIGECLEAPTGPSFPARVPLGRLDRIFVQGGARVRGCGVHQSPLASMASDHLPIWADIEITPDTPANG